MIHAAMRTRRSMILMKNAKRPPRADGAKEKKEVAKLYLHGKLKADNRRNSADRRTIN